MILLAIRKPFHGSALLKPMGRSSFRRMRLLMRTRRPVASPPGLPIRICLRNGGGSRSIQLADVTDTDVTKLEIALERFYVLMRAGMWMSIILIGVIVGLALLLIFAWSVRREKADEPKQED